MAVWAADAQHGAFVLEQQGCQRCHAIRGQGLGHEPPQTGRDLGERLAPTYGPHTLASALWNHTPAMWNEFAARGVPPADATESDWQDLFAYLYTLQFSEPPAEATRGKRVLEGKGCTQCHSLSKTPTTRGPSVSAWARVDDPVVLVAHLWNHAATMKNQFARYKIAWKTMTGRDLRDLTAYLQNVQTLVPDQHLSLPAPEAGKPLFDNYCGVCHRDLLSLAMKLRNKTWMDIGASMWNHAQQMPAIRTMPGDMRKILAYVWQLQYEGPPGDAVLGERAFSQKGCAECHRDLRARGAPVTAFTFVSAAWGPARRAHERILERGSGWPALSPADVSNFVAYLSSRNGAR